MTAALLLVAGLGVPRAELRTGKPPVVKCYDIRGRTGCVRGLRQPAPARNPLILFLHGYGGTSADDTLGLAGEALRNGVLYAYADGTPDQQGQATWRSIDQGKAADGADVAFLSDLVERIAVDWSVDPNRVFVAGWSLGGFLALRLACEKSSRFAAVVSYSGGFDSRYPPCAPAEPVSVLLIHGSADTSVHYEGGRGSRTGLEYPAAKTVFETWARLDGCRRPSLVPLEALDVDGAVEGPETERLCQERCSHGTAVELWTVQGGAHRPAMTSGGTSAILKFLLGHPKRNQR